MNFSERLKELREKKGLSQETLAEKLNIPRSTVTNYENNSNRIPRNNRLQEIADFFDVSVDYLLGRAETSVLNQSEEKFLEDMDNLTLEEIILKYGPTFDGKPVNEDELEVIRAVIRSLRGRQ